MMDKQERLVEEIFGAALERNPDDRKTFLDRACAPHAAEVRRQVEALLLEDERAGSFLGEPFGAFAGLQNQADSPTVDDFSAHPLAARAGEPSRFQAGQVIAGRFTVVRFIAHGGMGEVYEVDDRYLQHVHVALKVIRPEIAADAGASHRFEQEVLLARKVTHPHLCPIYDISRCEEPAPAFLFLTMKLLQGETLAARLRRSEPVSREEAISIFHQMTDGLAAIHAGGVIHRDIKPNNVMLEISNGERCLSIMDFGLARLHESETTIALRGVVAGTPGYIAPELYLGHRPSQATDIYALGVLLHQVLTGVLPTSRADSIAAEPSSALAVADVPRAITHAVEEFLAEDPKRRCDAFAKLHAHSRNSAMREELREVQEEISAVTRRPLLTRRRLLIGSAVAACAGIGGLVIERDRVVDWLQPLPRKRFVALLDWPTPEPQIKPMLLGVIDAIAAELARAEAFDHDLFVIAETTTSDLTTPAQLNEAREALGANLVLAAYGAPSGKDIHLSLRVLDAASTKPLREKDIRVPLDQQATLPERAVRAAARLLDVSSYSGDDERARPGTDSLEALAAFQAAEALIKQPNDTGLDAAIEKYKQAVTLDPNYAEAYAKLGRAYSRLYVLHRDAAALELARANCETALRLDPNSVRGHVSLAWVYQNTGDRQGASRELAKALSLDPANPDTLISQATLYASTGDWAHAEATFARVLSMRPNYWLAHNELGVIYNSQGKYAAALLEFQAASLAAPGNALAFSNLGSIYLQEGNLREALDNTRKSYALQPNDVAAVTLAEIYRAQHDSQHAVGYAEKAVELAPKEAFNWLELGDCYAESATRKTDAQAAYTRAMQAQEEELRAEPKNGPEWMLLALCRVKAHHAETAAALMAKAELLQADDIDSQLYKARILELLGHRDEALSTVTRCLQRGATIFQIESMPDLGRLRTDPRYRNLVKLNAAQDTLT
jgi:serine/threonine protein kinase/tetratricopeptide (TPR) repeat protein